MSVGLMDQDMTTYLLVPFNLEIMKLSAYYKKRKEIVVLSQEFSPEKHTKFFYRKDYEDGIYPPKMYKAKNLDYGGLAFSNNIYVPLPVEIERMKPDASIYSKMEDILKKATFSQGDVLYNNMMMAEHCRLSLDGKTIWPEYDKQFKSLETARHIVFHDYDLGAVDGAFEEIQKILARARTGATATRVGMKFPVRLKKGDDLLKWSTLKSNSGLFSLRYDGVMDDDVFIEWVSSNHEKAVYSQMEYWVTSPDYDPQYFVDVLLRQIFRQVVISRSYHTPFTLKFEEDLLPDPYWGQVLRLFNHYHNSLFSSAQVNYFASVADDTLYDFAASVRRNPPGYYNDAMDVKEVRKIFAFVRQKNYPLFKDFYECNARSLGGKI